MDLNGIDKSEEIISSFRCQLLEASSEGTKKYTNSENESMIRESTNVVKVLKL